MKLTIPNQLTLIRIVLTPVFIYLIIQPQIKIKLVAGIVFLVASITDWYDGYFARRLNLTSRWGQFMDPLADKFLVSSALLVFAYLDYAHWWMILIIIGRDVLITLLRLFAIYIGKPIITTVVAKWKTFLQMTYIFAILLYINIPGLPPITLSASNQPFFLWTTLVLSVIVILTIFSAVHYLIVNRSHLAELWQRTFKLIG